MKRIALISLVVVACSAASVRDYGNDANYDQPGYEAPAPAYGPAPSVKCDTYFDTVAVEKCEPYSDRICRTVQKETCQDVPDRNCRAIVASKQVRKCFDVQEKICGLKEDVQYETVQVATTVQKCHQDTERVCDTIYDAYTNRQEETQCIQVENPHCIQEDYTVQDKVCRTSTNFDCNSYGTYDYKVPNEYETNSGRDQGGDYGSNDYGNQHHQDYDVKGHSVNQGYGNQAYDSGKTYCKRHQEVKCYETPRTVTVQKCSRRSEKVCERLSELVPYVQDKQSCHNDDKKNCKLEHATAPKQVKKYVYSKQCRSVPRKICENADVKQLVPSCVGVTRKQCTYTPIEKCEEVPKKHCYKLFQKVPKKKCYPVKHDDYAEPRYEAEQQKGGYDAQDY